MKKLLVSLLLLTFLTPSLRADIPQDLPDSKYVGQASDDGVKAARKEQWQNIALAVGAIAVATVAIVLVANNKGHKSS